MKLKDLVESLKEQLGSSLDEGAQRLNRVSRAMGYTGNEYKDRVLPKRVAQDRSWALRFTRTMPKAYAVDTEKGHFKKIDRMSVKDGTGRTGEENTKIPSNKVNRKYLRVSKGNNNT